jgi:hypothetical protein
VVVFPPRNEPFEFGNQLNALYRDTLRRGPVSAFVDLEGWIVWIQEYLRYRVNGCSHFDASTRVIAQIGGGGVLPVCGSAPSGQVSFPPRDQSYDFGLVLNSLYRDSLNRGAVPTFVDLEGWIVWIQEYLRYRVNNCGHADALSRVFTQINGGGVLPTCGAPSPPPPPARTGTLVFQSGDDACQCWVGTITLYIDGAVVGTMTCTQTRSFTVSAGSHVARACDSTGCAQGTVNVPAGGVDGVRLVCSSGSRSFGRASPR